ncbi:MAG: phospholipase D-like domain-containing protein [Trueperella sp.]|nr:phospholipase D-like domain-containing protein [Trueperella sp.]
MTWSFRPKSEHAISALKWGAAGLVTAQAIAAATIISIDERRKRRQPPSDEFPYIEPKRTKVADSQITTYTYGEDLYATMLEAISSATQYIYFESFIVKADRVGYSFRDALIAAAERGVKVYIILDTVGNFNQDPRFRHFPQLPNLYVINFPILRFGTLTGKAQDRGITHRKLLCVDGKIGFVGGYNIGALYAEKWRDTHLSVHGPAARELDMAFETLWNVYRKRRQPVLPSAGIQHWSSEFQVIQNLPAFKMYPIRNTYLAAIRRATKRVWITMAYFVPDASMMNELASAARRGVDVRVLIPEYSNHIIADWVARSRYSELLAAGVRIFLFEEAMVHAKTMTVDGVWSTVGTMNIDRLSMAGNYEVNAEIFDTAQAQQMEEIFQVDLTNSHELLPRVWEQRPVIARAAEVVLRPLSFLV